MMEYDVDKVEAAVSLATKLGHKIEIVKSLLNHNHNPAMMQLTEYNIQSCFDQMSIAEKHLRQSIAAQDRQNNDNTKVTSSMIKTQNTQATPLDNADDINDEDNSASGAPLMQGEKSEFGDNMLVGFMQNDEASVLSRRMSPKTSSVNGEEEEQADKQPLVKPMESSHMIEQDHEEDDDDDMKFIQQAQNFENSLLAGKDVYKGKSPVAAGAQSSAISGQTQDEQPKSKEPSGRVEEVEVEEEDEDQESEENQKYINVLTGYFGYSKFRGLQLRVIKTLIEEKRDQLVVMATGQGKSLCYQLPALFLKGIAIVISPLISLMEDQVMALKLANVEACMLGSGQDNQAEFYHKIYSGQCRILYITPEFIDTHKELLESIRQKVSISLLAIDECHCVSQWGNDFRPAYRQVGSRFRELLKDTPFIALTATATPVVRRDILQSLQLYNPLVTITSFDRPNLYLSVSSKGDSLCSDLIKMMTETTTKGTDGADHSNPIF